MPRIIVTQTENGERNRLRHDHQKGVLEKQRVALNFPPIYQFQKLRPQLPLQRDSGIVFHARSDCPETFVGATERNRVLTEFDPHGEGIGRQRAFECDSTVKPCQKNVRFLRVERDFFQLDELVAITLEDNSL